MNLTIKTDTLTPELKKLLAKMQDPTPALRGAGEAIVALAQDAFTNPSVRPSPWAPLNPKTIEKKKKKGYGSKELIASGTLARSPRVASANKHAVVVSTDRAAGKWSLGAIHQLGAPKAGISARPFFPFDASGRATELAKKRVKSVVLAWLKK